MAAQGNTEATQGNIVATQGNTDLVSPQSVFVVAGEAVDHNRDGEGQDEDAAKGAETSYQLAREG